MLTISEETTVDYELTARLATEAFAFTFPPIASSGCMSAASVAARLWWWQRRH
jgi:hypothetical protein